MGEEKQINIHTYKQTNKYTHTLFGKQFQYTKCVPTGWEFNNWFFRR